MSARLTRAWVGFASGLFLAGSVLLGPPDAHAEPPTTVHAYPANRAPADVLISGSGLASDVVVRMTSEGNAFEITDPLGIVAGEGCEALSATAASCLRRTPLIRGALDDGNDRLELVGEGVRTPFMSAGPGADRLLGGPQGDRLVGDAGADRLRGRGGRDRLIGGRGADALAGGRGGDLLFAADRRRDRSIRCGGGRRDRAVVDASDPKPKGCERVIVEG